MCRRSRCRAVVTFTTLVEYSSFLPYREHSPACNDDGVDKLLAVTSTIVFYACIIPVVLLMLRVLTPCLPSRLQFPVPPKALKLGSYRNAKQFLDCLNPLKWLMRGLYSSVLKLVAVSSPTPAQVKPRGARSPGYSSKPQHVAELQTARAICRHA